MHVFQLLSTIKVRLVDKMMQSDFLCVILLVKYKKCHFSPFERDFLILNKIEEGDHCW